jgi:hypothetical protein
MEVGVPITQSNSLRADASLSSAKSTEVFCSAWYEIVVKLENDAT